MIHRRRFIQIAGAAGAAPLASIAALDASTPAKPVASTPYAPGPKPKPVARAGEFVFAAAHLDHGHINSICAAFIAAGATLKFVYDPDAKKVEAFRRRFPQAVATQSLDSILADKEVQLVAAAAVPHLRGPLGCRIMEAGKDYFTDKAPFTTLAQLADARRVVAATRRKFGVYYSGRITSEAAVFTTRLLREGVLGRVVQVVSLAPHRLNKAARPSWFFEREKYGGILCDLGSHLCDEFLTYAGATDANVVHAAVGNFANPDSPELEDFGEAALVGNNGATNHQRVDWFTPDGLGTWGDGRTFILGTKGYIEMRKYTDPAREKRGNHVYLVDDKGEHHLNVDGQVGFPFFGEFILDCMNRTENAVTQTHTFKAAELSLQAQATARRLT